MGSNGINKLYAFAVMSVLLLLVFSVFSPMQICPAAGRKLTDDELFNLAIERQVVGDFGVTTTRDGMKLRGDLKGWPSASAYRQEFPMCCEVEEPGPTDRYIAPTWYQSITGQVVRVLKLDIHTPSFGEDGQPFWKPTTMYVLPNRCGNIN